MHCPTSALHQHPASLPQHTTARDGVASPDRRCHRADAASPSHWKAPALFDRHQQLYTAPWKRSVSGAGGFAGPRAEKRFGCGRCGSNSGGGAGAHPRQNSFVCSAGATDHTASLHNSPTWQQQQQQRHTDRPRPALDDACGASRGSSQPPQRPSACGAGQRSHCRPLLTPAHSPAAKAAAAATAHSKAAAGHPGPGQKEHLSSIRRDAAPTRCGAQSSGSSRRLLDSSCWCCCGPA